MKQESAQDIALMRYSMISPLIVGLPDEYRSKEAYFRAASARGALHPNGSFIAPDLRRKRVFHVEHGGTPQLVTLDADVLDTPDRGALAIETARVHVEEYRVALELREVDARGKNTGAVAVKSARVDDKIFCHSSKNRGRHFSFKGSTVPVGHSSKKGFCSGRRTRTADLEGMNLASCLPALSRDIVAEAGIEPATLRE